MFRLGGGCPCITKDMTLKAICSGEKTNGVFSVQLEGYHVPWGIVKGATNPLSVPFLKNIYSEQINQWARGEPNPYRE